MAWISAGIVVFCFSASRMIARTARPVVRLKPAAEGVSHQLFGKGGNELVAMLGQQQLLQSGGAAERGAVGQLA